MMPSPPRCIVPALVVVAALALTACATRRLAPDFTTFSDAYAENMNRQMLLNLARLDQGHPAYFMAIGEIRLSRSQSGSLQGTGNSSHTEGSTIAANISNTVTNVLSGNLNASGQNAANPTFVFIPINSEEASKQLLAPIPVEVFATLFEQGWPVDQLMRVLVERIEVRFAEPGRPPILLMNSPTRGNAELFARFLRTCEVIRELQVSGGLRLTTDERFTRLSAAEVDASRLTAKDLNDAADKGRTWERGPNGGLVLGARRSRLHFVTEAGVVDSTLAHFRTSARAFASPIGQAEIRNIEAVLKSRPEIKSERHDDAEASGPPETDEIDSRGDVETVLILRSYRNLLEAVAQEQRAFDQLARGSDFLSGVPERQQRPVLRTDWTDDTTKLEDPVIALNYAGRAYAISDPADADPTTLDSRWNRDIFRLLLNLSSQVTVDITKFQRQVLELSQ